MTIVRNLCLVVALLGLVAVADAAPIRVSQESAPGAGDFDSNILGFVNPFATGLTTAGFYQYGSPNGASYNGELNGGPSGIDSVSQLFLVQASDGLSLVNVHDLALDGTGGNARTRFDLSGDTASILVKDDGGENYTDTGIQFTAIHNWIGCCTDGYAIGSLDGNWEMLGQFTATPGGITRWAVTDSSGALIPLVLDPGRRVRLDLPEPASIALLGFAGVVLLRRRRKSA